MNKNPVTKEENTHYPAKTKTEILLRSLAGQSTSRIQADYGRRGNGIPMLLWRIPRNYMYQGREVVEYMRSRPDLFPPLRNEHLPWSLPRNNFIQDWFSSLDDATVEAPLTTEELALLEGCSVEATGIQFHRVVRSVREGFFGLIKDPFATKTIVSVTVG